MFSEDDENILIHQIGNGWLKLRNKNILITGGTGFIGKWLVGGLLLANKKYALNCKITLLTRNLNASLESNKCIAQNPAVSFLERDVRFLQEHNAKYDIIIHAATDIANKNSPLDTFDVCAQGTRSVLDLAIRSNATNFILISSGAVYGQQPPELNQIPESYNGMPDRTSENSAYGLGKITAEWLTSQYGRSYGLNTKIARCFAFVGPHLPMDKHFAIGNFIKDSVHGNKIVINGNGSPIRTYLYAADLANWIWRILLDGDNGDIYNVGGDRHISIKDLAHLIRSLINPEVEIIIKNKLPGNTPPERYVPDVTSAKNKLGLCVNVSLEDSIKKTATWLIERTTQ